MPTPAPMTRSAGAWASTWVPPTRSPSPPRGLLVWAVFASVIQVLVYRRGLRDWDQLASADARGENLDGDDPPAASEPAPPARLRGRFDPRAVTLAAAVAFALLLVSTEWLVLGAVSAWLALAWASAPTDREPVPVGLLFAAVLGLGALVFTLGGGLGLDLALRRALRAALIVLVATWLRAAAGAEGLREVFRRALGRLRAIPSLPEAVTVLDGIAAEGRLVAAARTLADRLRGVALRPLPFLDAVLDWVVGEAQAFRPLGPGIPPTLALRARDVLLVVLAGAAPAIALTFA